MTVFHLLIGPSVPFWSETEDVTRAKFNFTGPFIVLLTLWIYQTNDSLLTISQGCLLSGEAPTSMTTISKTFQCCHLEGLLVEHISNDFRDFHWITRRNNLCPVKLIKQHDEFEWSKQVFGRFDAYDRWVLSNNLLTACFKLAVCEFLKAQR